MKKIDKIFYNIINFLLLCLGYIPIKIANKLAFVLGDFVRFIDYRHRLVAIENLRHAYGPEIKANLYKHTIKEVYRNLCKLIFEISWLMKVNHKELDKRIKLKGSKNLIEATIKGEGVLIISGHIGAWELLPYVIAKLNIIVNIIYRPLDFFPLNKFIEEFRSMFGGRLITTKRAMPKINAAIKRGEAVGLLIDQSADWYNGVWVKFFGHKTCTSIGAASIALSNQIPVIPVFIFREKDEYRVFFQKPVPLIRTGDRSKDIEVNTSNYTKIIETEIRKHPEQWFWVHRRWKNKPFSIWPRK